MYDDVVLFEDFIHDHGVVRMSVKTRIMPRCWYVLLRYWLRVDGVAMKVNEQTRHLDYCEERFVCCLVISSMMDLAESLHLARS